MQQSLPRLLQSALFQLVPILGLNVPILGLFPVCLPTAMGAGGAVQAAALIPEARLQVHACSRPRQASSKHSGTSSA
jgi:hypothetical protein